MKLYVIGKVTGAEDDNVHAFERARTHLQAAGYEVEIPHDTIPSGTEWFNAMRISIANMLACDGVATLDGWIYSKGASLEHNIAEEVLLPIASVDTWLAVAKDPPFPTCKITEVIDYRVHGRCKQTYRLSCGHSRTCDIGERFHYCDQCGAVLLTARKGAQDE